MKKLFALLTLMTSLAMAQPSPHGRIDIECQNCHATDSWAFKKNASFKHETYGFALTGQHASLACASCHEGLKFEEVKSSCSSCHSDVHKAELGPSCARCHNASAWQMPDMVQRHEQTRFPLLGRHSSAGCQACHVRASEHQYAGTPTSCIGCHRNDFVQTSSPNHQAAGFSTQCEECHSLTAFTWGQGFDHNATAFPLNGAHTSTACVTCHKNQVFKSTPTQCVSCHRQDFTAASSPNHTAAQFSTECQSCHTTAGWQGGRYNHNQTQFPLTGAHQPLSCASCHGDNVFQGKPTNCYPCHQQDFVGTVNPNHVLGGFSQQCQTCHATSAWQPSTFSHAGTQFPLTGAHQSVQCSNCHVNGQYQGTPTNCFACHQQDFTTTTAPNHVAGGFPHECQSCHTTTAWLPSSFNHSNTQFPLTGAHQTALCSNCHVNGQYQGTPTNCYACHQQDFTGTANPNHVTAGFPQECQTCHTTAAWAPSSFNHSATQFPLTGAHQSVQCSNCHVNGQYQGTPTNCYACHQQDFTGTTNPNHVTAGFPQECQTCHTTAAWTPSSFNHSNTPFPLTGAHQSVACANCHINGQYQGTPTDCFACHQNNFNGTVNPSHVSGNFPHQCVQCHTTSAWQPATFDHSTTNFQLTGAHTAQQCQSCHTNGNYQLVYQDCFQCHQTDFQQPVNPNHAAGNFSHNCVPCHTTTGWSPSTFSHNSTTFPLTGAHQAVSCSNCHVNNQYQGLPTACFDCHTNDFTGATNPNHVTGNFNHDCLQCHSTGGWSPATFNHAQTNFPLTGSHIQVQCQSCHTNGNYQLVYNDCYQCHQADYAIPTNPNHVQLQLSHRCESCHSTVAWQPSTFNHDTQFFRIYSGAHHQAWTSCGQCHPSIGNYADFTCISCHEHRQSSMDSQHQGVNGYVYSSPACYDCHRNAL